MKNILSVSDLWFRYTEHKEDVLKGINLEIEKGEVVKIVGLSGCGKSTLCYALAGIIPHYFNGLMKGDVYIAGESTAKLNLAQIATRLGIVFQNPDNQLFSPTVEDEIAFGPENLCLERKEIEERVTEALQIVNMEDYRFQSPENLSGGEKQLIAVASVLALKPQILIFDEVKSQLDVRGKEKINQIIDRLKRENKTIILVEHELNNHQLADRELLLSAGKLEKFQGALP